MTGKAFHGGASFDAIGKGFDDLNRRHDVVDADVLDAWYPPSPNVAAAIAPHLEWLIKTSPPTHAEGLRECLQGERGITPERLVLGNGTSSLMFLAFPKLLKPGERAALLDPTYGEYRHLVEDLCGGEVVPIELREEDGFRTTPEAIAKRAQGCALVVLVNPNSPTGVILTRIELQKLLDILPETTRVWLDETYIDFVNDGAETMEPVEDERLIVAKSMSKFYGLSGLRIGYLVCAPDLAADLERQSPPWSIGLLAQVAAVEALRDRVYYAARVVQTARGREVLMKGVAEIEGLTPVGADANYFLFRTDRVPSDELCRRTAARNVFLRDCDNLSPRFGTRWIRTAVKDADANACIIGALHEASH